MSNPWDSVYHDLRKPFYEGDDKKQKNIKAAKKGKRWQDNDADGKWYEKGTDVKEASDEQKAAIERAKLERIQDQKVSSKKKESVKEEGIADIIARLEKKRISKGGDPKESPLPSMRKYHAAKKKKKEAKEEVVQEADSLSAQVARWEAGRQRRMKRSGSYERPNWIPRDQDHEDRYGSSKGEKKKKTPKKNANLQNEEGVINHIDGSKTEIVDVVPNLHARKRGHQDWKSDLGSVFENANCCAKCGSYKHTTKECKISEASNDFMRHGSSKTAHPTDKPIKEGGVKNKVTINPVVNVESKVDEAIGTLTNADKVGNTPAWQNRNKLNKAGKPLYNLAPHLQANENEPEGDMVEAKVDAGKSPEEKEKVRNKRKFGVSHNVAGHGKLRRSLHRMNRGDKKIPGDKSKWMEMEDVNVKKSSPLDHSLEEKKSSSYDEPNWEKRKKNNEKARKEMAKDAKDSGWADKALKASLSKGAGVSEGSINWTPKTVKKDKKDMSKKSGTAKNDYRLMAQSYDPEGEVISELDLKKVGTKLRYELGKSKQIDALKNIPNKLRHGLSDEVSHNENGQLVSELDNMGGPAALVSMGLAGIGLAKSGYDAFRKTADNLKKNIKKRTQLNQETELQGDLVDEGSPYDDKTGIAGKQIKGDKITSDQAAKIRKIIQGNLPKAEEVVHEDAKMGKQSDEKLAALHKQFSSMDQSSPANAHMTKRVQREINRRKKNKLKEHHTKDADGKVIEHGDGTPSSVEEKSLLDQVADLAVAEATRYKKEKGYVKGGTKKKPSGAMAAVIAKIEKEHGKGSIVGRTQQKKKVKGAKSTSGTGKYLKKAQDKKAYAAKAKKAGFKSTQAYTDTMARYGGEDNYKKGKGLGT
tara:strand:+ start:2291 stop:4897 length:2607 start_codon:yes stop_codon:yes gene_type:complete